MKIKWKKLIVCLLIPLAAGGLSALLTKDSMGSFDSINKPPLSPPGWVFPIVWTVLFILMGIASYLVSFSGNRSQTALTFYGIQLFFNFVWSLIFFNFSQYFLAFMWLAILWFLILITTALFYMISKPAAYLMIPYLIWVTFAGYLNFSICLLN